MTTEGRLSTSARTPLREFFLFLICHTVPLCAKLTLSPSRWEASDAAIQATLARLTSISLLSPSPITPSTAHPLSASVLAAAPPVPRTILIPKWDEHRLPDGTLYWSRLLSYDTPALALVTDIDLRESGTLAKIEGFLARSSNPLGNTANGTMGLETLAVAGQPRDIWLAYAGSLPATEAPAPNPAANVTEGIVAVPDPFKMVVIDHNKRETLLHVSDSKQKNLEEEIGLSTFSFSCCVQIECVRRYADLRRYPIELELEHAYWSFVEAHPAHRDASEKDHKDAMEFLCWCQAGKLSPSNTGIPCCFLIPIAPIRSTRTIWRATDDPVSVHAGPMPRTHRALEVCWRYVFISMTQKIYRSSSIVFSHSTAAVFRRWT